MAFKGQLVPSNSNDSWFNDFPCFLLVLCYHRGVFDGSPLHLFHFSETKQVANLHDSSPTHGGHVQLTGCRTYTFSERCCLQNWFRDRRNYCWTSDKATAFQCFSGMTQGGNGNSWPKIIVWSSNRKYIGHKAFLPFLPTAQITSVTTDSYNWMNFHNELDLDF